MKTHKKKTEMSAKEDILNNYKRNKGAKSYDMPRLDDIEPVTFPDPLVEFKMMSRNNGANIIEVAPGQDLDTLVKECYPDAKTIASALPEIKSADRNPDTVADAQALDGTDVGVVRARFGVAENGCMWIEQDVREKAVYFISEYLVILLPQSRIYNNMHEAYRHLEFNDNNFGTFIAGPSKTADIAQVLVVGAQAARGVTIFLMPE